VPITEIHDCIGLPADLSTVALKPALPRMSTYVFKPIKHNWLVAALAKQALQLRTRQLQKVIFTATTGRSGTLSLAKIFSSIPECFATHEAHPVMNGPVLEAASYDNAALVDRVYGRIKSINIRRASLGHRYYMEANHLFIKTFIQQAIQDFGDRLTIIHLVRPPVEVATSIYRLQEYPGTEIGNRWWLDFRAPSNLIRMAEILDSRTEFSHPFYRALWYWYEVEQRISAWRARIPGLRIARFETDWLNDIQRIFALLDGLDMVYDKQRVAALVGIREHDKEQMKKSPALPPAQAQEMASRFRDLLMQRGFELPREGA
jgi:hypothetical protein